MFYELRHAQDGPVNEPYEVNHFERVLAIPFGPCLYQYIFLVQVLRYSRITVVYLSENRSLKH